MCLEVAQSEPLFTPNDFAGTPCGDDAHRCPDRTTCIPVDLCCGQQTSYCAYGCTTSSTIATGCEDTGFPTCDEIASGLFVCL